MTLRKSILVTLILASIVIGIASLFAQRQNLVHGSRSHERAVKLAQEIASQIQRDKSHKESYESILGASCETKSSKSKATTSVVACWQDKVEQQLTNGSARIWLDHTTLPAQYVIIVSWSEPRTGTASYVLRVKQAIINAK